jgi:uroporphyrinogen III methyltransferase/synthase
LLVEYVPEEYRAERIAEGLRGKIVAGERVLLPRAAEARLILPEMLRQMGALVTDVTAYRTVPATDDGRDLQEKLTRGEIDLVTFTSSSTVRNFLGLVGKDFFLSLPRLPVTACIGPITADTAKNLGVRVDVLAKEYTINGLVEAIIDYEKVLSK